MRRNEVMAIQKKSLSASNSSKKASKTTARGSKAAARGAKTVNLKRTVVELPAVQ
jgi:hypothetical protein